MKDKHFSLKKLHIMLTEIIASFIAKWKVANPKIYGILVVVLIVVHSSIVALQNSGVVAVDMTEIASWLTFLVALFVHHVPETPKYKIEGEEPDEYDPSNDPIDDLIADTATAEPESLIAPITPKKRGRPRKV